MEKRAIVAIVLSVALLLAWQALFSPAPAPPPAPGTSEPSSPVGPSGAPLPDAGVPVPRPLAPPASPAGARAEVSTPLYQATFGADGGATSWVLRYRGAKELLVGRTFSPLAVGLRRPGEPPEVLVLRPQAERLVLTAEEPAGTLTFRGRTADGLEVDKTLRFRADSYQIEVELRVQGQSEPGDVTLYWTSPVALPGATRDAPWLTFGEGTERQQLLGRILVARDGSLEAFDAPPPALKDPKESPSGPELKDANPVPALAVPAQRGWVALENDYFIAALVPGEGSRLLRGRERDLAEVGVVFPDVRVEAGRPWQGRIVVYTGPKEWDRLAALGAGLEQAQARNYGHLLWIPFLSMELFCVPLLWLMNIFAAHLPGKNYGVAIVLLTVLVKIIFYPLTHKSMSSMKQMQALQPQLNALRAKHKADPQRFQREQMELFRKHGVNPMGGCLPMIVQVPIFYALYLVLQYSVELQGAPFVLWITDLSRKDPYYVLPILMGISMLVQQKMTPSVGDPRQARVMLIMPVIFTFMFLEFPTGLVLYWLVNNVLSIAQQYWIDRVALRKKAVAALDAKTDRAPRKV